MAEEAKNPIQFLAENLVELLLLESSFSTAKRRPGSIASLLPKEIMRVSLWLTPPKLTLDRLLVSVPVEMSNDSIGFKSRS